MFEFLSLITKKRYWKLHSFMIKIILRFYGIKTGKGFYCEGIPHLKIGGKAEFIQIGDNVSIFGNIDLRNRENGKIIIEDNVSFDHDVRLVSAREGTIRIGSGSAIGPYTIMNGGGSILIGQKCLFAKSISINANDHQFEKSSCIRDQGFTYGDIVIEDDVWLGANVCINKGVKIQKGSIIGANAVVTKNTEEYSINAGVPSRMIGMRT
ncbi:acetyltransferase [Sulfuricurvum kujiense DSM 16994]|uniref:Acetyltransferase n=1 Tax=Sulfuricurvum kujiense (strain ATCC BAA-921 / DSM 16994 / JCM 11577 / YK-1) TaxID=709032 RepID=E4TYA0_SULKY|nr:acyltransferase [Sulfuricurvum kujiense]ADR35045.1 acetyltransferase [Sulfuricurvum kujiense DSM 16994]